MSEVEKLSISLDADATGYKSGLDTASADTDSFLGGLSSKFGAVGPVLAGVGLAAVGALAGVGLAAFDMASDVTNATNSIQTQLGLTKDGAEVLSGVAVDIFGNNFADSIEDATQSLITVRHQMRGLADEELQAVTEKALAIRDVFDIDVAESTNAANTLMSQFGLTSTEAFDFIVAGNQRGLNASGDFLETIGEYSVQFAESGATADEFFSVLETGMAGGVLGTDKIADAFKESRIRIMGMSEDVVVAFETIGDSEAKNLSMGGATKGQAALDLLIQKADEFGLTISDDLSLAVTQGATDFDSAFASLILNNLDEGKISLAEVQGIAIESMGRMDDAVEQNSAGVAIFGTQWEDAGASAILGVDMARTGLEDLAGATDGLNAKYNSLGAMFGGVWRKVQTEVLLPIGNKLLELANTIMPYVSGAISTIGAVLGGGGGLAGIVGRLGDTFSNLLPTITTGLSTILTGMMAWVSASVPGWIAALGQFAQGAIQWVADALPALLGNLATFEQQMIGWVMAAAPGWIASLAQLGGNLVVWVLDALPGLITNLGAVLLSMYTWVLDSLPGWGAQLLALGNQLWQWVVDALPGLGTQLGTVLVSLLTWVGTAITTLVPKLLELGGKFVSWIATDVLPNLPGALANILLALGTFLGNVLIEVVPKLAELGGKFLSWVTDDVLPELPGKLGEIWTAISSWIGDVVGKAATAAGDIGQAIIDGIGSVIDSGMGIVVEAVRSVINPIIGFLNTVIDGANAVASALGFDTISPIPYLALGTNNWMGGLAIAGEKGPELAFFGGKASLLTGGVYDLPRGTQVIPARQSAAMMGGGRTGGDGDVYIDARGAADPMATEAAVRRAMNSTGSAAIARILTRR